MYPLDSIGWVISVNNQAHASHEEFLENWLVIFLDET